MTAHIFRACTKKKVALMFGSAPKVRADKKKVQDNKKTIVTLPCWSISLRVNHHYTANAFFCPFLVAVPFVFFDGVLNETKEKVSQLFLSVGGLWSWF